MRSMKMLLLLLLLVPVTFGQSIEERVKKFENPKAYEVKYDKFQKETNVEITLKLSSKKGFLTLYPHIVLKDDGEYYVIMLASGGAYRFHTQPTMRFLLDGNLLELKSDDIDDIVGFSITNKDFEKIASAKLVEVQLGFFEGQFDAKTQTAFKNLYSLTKSPR